MPVMMEKLYDALRAANVPEPQARAAAVEAAEHETRLGAIKAKLSALESRVSMLTWVMGINLTLTAVILAKLFTLR